VAKLKLTVKEAKLVKGVAAGKPKYIAAIEAGYSPKSAPQIADETLKKPNVQNALQLALEKAGITPELIMAPVVDALRHEELETRLKGHDRAVKIVQPKQADGPTINNFGTIVAEMKDRYED